MFAFRRSGERSLDEIMNQVLGKRGGLRAGAVSRPDSELGSCCGHGEPSGEEPAGSGWGSPDPSPGC